MNLEDFDRIAQLVGNTTWVRTFLASYPGFLVLEVANIDGSDLDCLAQDLISRGFSELPAIDRQGILCRRFSIKRGEHRIEDRPWQIQN